MNFVCLPFTELSTIQLYAILRLRSEVFVIEQACIYQDLDNKDTQTDVQHLMMLDNKKLLGYARLLPSGLSYNTPSIGRIIISPSARSKGFGRLLIQEAIDHTLALWPEVKITIGAQSHLSSMYQSFGFKEISEHYLEDDILHVDMSANHP